VFIVVRQTCPVQLLTNILKSAAQSNLENEKLKNIGEKQIK
jgi:hypothetical protein